MPAASPGGGYRADADALDHRGGLGPEAADPVAGGGLGVFGHAPAETSPRGRAAAGCHEDFASEGMPTEAPCTLSIGCDASGERFRHFKDALQDYEPAQFMDSSIKGPTTSVGYCRFIRQYGNNPLEWCQRWLLLTKLPSTDFFVNFHETLEASLIASAAHRTGRCIRPVFSEWNANEMKDEATILNECRKGREERGLAKPRS